MGKIPDKQANNSTMGMGGNVVMQRNNNEKLIDADILLFYISEFYLKSR